MQALQEKIKTFREEANRVLLGKPRTIDKALCCIFAGGHLLIEDIPGVGKTTLVRLLARLLGLSSNRIQCTNDLLPADITGSNILDSRTSTFRFQPGPVFAQLVIADELNRATPKTQSACLQAMQEGEVSIDGVTYQLPEPFIVVATQNPLDSTGTFPLPESQLDRFLMKIDVGWPDRATERRIIADEGARPAPEDLEPVLGGEEVLEIRRLVRGLHLSEEVLDYIQDMVAESRNLSAGLSTRAAMDLAAAARAAAFLDGRDYVIPDDVRGILGEVSAHRIGRTGSAEEAEETVRTMLRQINAP